jgi:hypothetical protein
MLHTHRKIWILLVYTFNKHQKRTVKNHTFWVFLSRWDNRLCINGYGGYFRFAFYDCAFFIQNKTNALISGIYLEGFTVFCCKILSLYGFIIRCDIKFQAGNFKNIGFFYLVFPSRFCLFGFRNAFIYEGFALRNSRLECGIIC